MPFRSHFTMKLFDSYLEFEKLKKGIYYHDVVANNDKITHIQEKSVMQHKPYIFIHKRYE